mmetsp:Transcript_36785/g.85586  ORF Transcript_36785/g.85586 Transcript_36785/m.85586 type:complete len:208 (+) Transcript_36785:539-1162(+)
MAHASHVRPPHMSDRGGDGPQIPLPGFERARGVPALGAPLLPSDDMQGRQGAVAQHFCRGSHSACHLRPGLHHVPGLHGAAEAVGAKRGGVLVGGGDDDAVAPGARGHLHGPQHHGLPLPGAGAQSDATATGGVPLCAQPHMLSCPLGHRVPGGDAEPLHLHLGLELGGRLGLLPRLFGLGTDLRDALVSHDLRGDSGPFLALQSLS